MAQSRTFVYLVISLNPLLYLVISLNLLLSGNRFEKLPNVAMNYGSQLDDPCAFDDSDLTRQSFLAAANIQVSRAMFRRLTSEIGI